MKTIKYSVSGLLVYGVYRYVLPTSVSEVCADVASRAWSSLQRVVSR